MLEPQPPAEPSAPPDSLARPAAQSTSPLKGLPKSTIEDHLLRVHAAAKGALDSAIREQAARIGRLLLLDIDIKAWEERIADRPEVRQLIDGRRNLAFGVYLAAVGAYSQAYSGLRAFLELSFASVYFSANELARRRWMADRWDFSWKRALDQDEGVLSHGFVREFNEGIVNDANRYAIAANTCYRHCSQFLHGKVAATAGLPEGLQYSSNMLESWMKTAHAAAESVLFLLFCRYGKELLLADDGHLAATLEHSFLHLPSVRSILGLPVEVR